MSRVPVSRRSALAGLLGCAASGLPARAAAAALPAPGIDFSHAGFGGGGVPVPAVPARFLVRPSGGRDDTALLQAGIDAVSELAPDSEGVRGAVLLGPGRFNVAGQLRMRTGGVVLRGSRSGGTALVATGHDTRYWQYRPDSTLWAPKGGRNKAFREAVTEDFGRMSDHAPATSPEQAYRQVREYRERFPDKAVVAWHNGVGQLPALLAGAAQVLMRNPPAGHDQGRKIDRMPLDAFLREHLGTDLPRMDAAPGLVEGAGPSWALADARRRTLLLASMSGPQIALGPQLQIRKMLSGLWFSSQTGATLNQRTLTPKIDKPDSGEWLLLLRLS